MFKNIKVEFIVGNLLEVDMVFFVFFDYVI